MQVTDEMIDKLAGLAKLRFSEAEKEGIKADLQNMIGLVEKMNELDTEGVKPLLHITPNVNVMREDVLQGSISNEDALKNAAQKTAPFFIVPKVIIKSNQ